MVKRILPVGTLDLKGQEVEYFTQRVEERDWSMIAVDIGTLGEPPTPLQIPTTEIIKLGVRICLE
jgi:uncharacterized protein (UPF0261 family)